MDPVIVQEDVERPRRERDEDSSDEGADPSEDEAEDVDISQAARLFARMGGTFTPVSQIVDVGLSWEVACATWLANYAANPDTAGPDPRTIPPTLFNELSVAS